VRLLETKREGLTVYHGDAVNVCAALADASVEAVITDPPYSSGTRREASKGLRKSMTRSVEDEAWFTTDCLTTNGFVWLMRACALEWHRVLVPGGHVLCFIDWRMYPPLAGAIESADLRHSGLLVWDKTHFGMGACFRNQHELILHFTKGRGREPQRRDQSNVIACPAIRDAAHPTEKPVELIEAIITTVCPVGGTVLDCFSGSGATGEAALSTGRRVILAETSERWAQYSVARLDRKFGCLPVPLRRKRFVKRRELGQPDLFADS
jgi:site-specific DNA-methyltransferase (adenine-specific)